MELVSKKVGSASKTDNSSNNITQLVEHLENDIRDVEVQAGFLALNKEFQRPDCLFDWELIKLEETNLGERISYLNALVGQLEMQIAKIGRQKILPVLFSRVRKIGRQLNELTDKYPSTKDIKIQNIISVPRLL